MHQEIHGFVLLAEAKSASPHKETPDVIVCRAMVLMLGINKKTLSVKKHRCPYF